MLTTIKKLELQRETVKRFGVKTSLRTGKVEDPPQASSQRKSIYGTVDQESTPSGDSACAIPSTADPR